MTPDAEDDGSGTIEYGEFLMLMTHKILMIISDAEDESSGAIEYDEFLRMMKHNGWLHQRGELRLPSSTSTQGGTSITRAPGSGSPIPAGSLPVPLPLRGGGQRPVSGSIALSRRSAATTSAAPGPLGALLTSAEVSSRIPRELRAAINENPQGLYEWRATPDSLPPRRVGPISTGAERQGRFETESERVRHQLPEVDSQRTS